MIIYEGDAKYERRAYLEIKDNKVIFDCSGEEYGPIKFPLELLKEKLKELDES